ncbi:hypothetical protein MRB53_006391 [Persea americana]|uniref:Uncharacterized protein n=1 Tax=Persea americana TaxID=3435 RepID=A0ACC2MGJ4_PERAE|nr:hypothetical protein MRB53_006391 [Persea americana]
MNSPKCSQLKAKLNVYMTSSACHSTNRCGSPTASSGSSSKAKTGAGPEYHKNGSDTTVWQLGKTTAAEPDNGTERDPNCNWREHRGRPKSVDQTDKDVQA